MKEEQAREQKQKREESRENVFVIFCNIQCTLVLADDADDNDPSSWREDRDYPRAVSSF